MVNITSKSNFDSNTDSNPDSNTNSNPNLINYGGNKSNMFILFILIILLL